MSIDYTLDLYVTDTQIKIYVVLLYIALTNLDPLSYQSIYTLTYNKTWNPNLAV